jgi:hypothetical protein
MWKFCTGGVCDLRGALRHAREPRAASYRQRRRSTRVDPSISARRSATTSRTTSSGRGFSTVNRIVPFDKSKPGSRSRTSSTTRDLNGKTLRWRFAAAKPSTQPIAVDDVICYLVGVLGHPDALGRVFEVGGPEILRYSTMLKRVAEIERRPLPIVPVPLLSPRLSSWWLALVTDVDTQAGRALVDSMTTEVVVHDESIREIVPMHLTSYDDAVRQALDERRKRNGR